VLIICADRAQQTVAQDKLSLYFQSIAHGCQVA
jgi:hypothetical protein